MLEEIVGWPCFRSFLSFAGFSFSSSFESKHEKQPISPNQIEKRFFLSKTINNTRCIQTQSTGSYSNPIIPQIPITTRPKFWASLSLPLRSAWERWQEIGRKRRSPKRKDKASESKFHETPPTTITKRNRKPKRNNCKFKQRLQGAGFVFRFVLHLL